jgi:type III restriction enzyme
LRRAPEQQGAHLYSGDDSREKRDIGTVWAAASYGRCLFAMVTSPSAANGRSVLDQLRSVIQ